jgi:hypothetical protein
MNIKTTQKYIVHIMYMCYSNSKLEAINPEIKCRDTQLHVHVHVHVSQIKELCILELCDLPR